VVIYGGHLTSDHRPRRLQHAQAARSLPDHRRSIGDRELGAIHSIHGAGQRVYQCCLNHLDLGRQEVEHLLGHRDVFGIGAGAAKAGTGPALGYHVRPKGHIARLRADSRDLTCQFVPSDQWKHGAA
jgi:hypothetical protein